MIMNKKVSTIFAMAALMGGVFCSSAYAESLKTYVDTTPVDFANGNYFLKIGDEYLASRLSDNKKSVEYFSEDDIDAEIVANDASNEEKQEALNQYLWTVSAVSGLPGNVTAYTFKNVATGEFIRVSGNEGSYAVEDETAAETGDTFYETYFQVGKDGTSKYDKNGSKFSLQKAGENDFISYDGTTQAFSFGAETTGETITLQKLLPGVIVDDDALNKLYNSAGFNFDLKDSKLADVANIFGEKRIVAIKVPSEPREGAEPIAKVGGETIFGIRSTKDANYGFPAGIYFATVKPNGKLEDQSDKFDFLTRCTFVAVDADSNIADDENAQKAGTGFTLTEVSGKDLVLYLGDDDDYKATGNQNSVYNACFSAKESTTENDVFDLSLAKVRFQEKAGAAKQVENGPLTLTASKGASGVSTTTSTNVFAFKYAESSVIKPITLLKEDGASIYNIKFYLKNGNDNTVNGKYLTMDADGSDFQAKGYVLADLNTPAYQWVISKVDGSDITFTNRENGKTLTTKLFNEGENLYSLAPVNQDLTFNYYNVTEAGDVLVGKKSNGAIDTQDFQGSFIELIPVEAADYEGYLNVDNETVMTLSFGRDIAPTSNKLYPYAQLNVLGSSYEYDYAQDEYVTNEIGKAAQWLLIKSVNNSHPVKYNYAYANGDLVNTKTLGDVVYAYTYKLQLVIDGKARNQYLDLSGSTITWATTENAAQNFYIQENVDGSVYLKTSRNADEAILLNSFYSGESMSELKDHNFSVQSIIPSTAGYGMTGYLSKADDVKTYLIAEAPAISLPAVEGHYSFINENGNYITMNEERDGLTVKEESEPLYLYVTDEDAVVPSFYITKAAENKAERMFLFNPQDSVNYYVAEGAYNKTYQLSEMNAVNKYPTKAIFKAASINETRDTLTTSIKGESTLVAMDANNTEKVEGGLKRFKMQITEAPDADGMYVIRQVNDNWLYAVNGKLAWTDKKSAAMLFEIEGAAAPTATEGVSATEVKVIATDGAINIKNAAGKNVVISTILGQIVANEVITSDNATISVPAGIAIVSVDGEEAVKVSVK